MKKTLLFILLCFSMGFVFSQTVSVSGTIVDASTNETIIGANVLYAEGKGTVTDVEGNFYLNLKPGTYTLLVSYVGYEDYSQQIVVENKSLLLNISMNSLTIDEVIIVADVARNRETPVAYSNINLEQVSSELAGQDLPMILNNTPGVYATEQGGGDGDARITIRGFDQRNVAVMIDGIPVNDMENGWVYWSNWFGLESVMRMMQVQRGLGNSQLALPSVGGTLNIITKGIENRRSTTINQEIDQMGKIKTSVGFTSGKLDKGWGITLAGSYKRGNGWVNNTYSEGWFYYAKIDKRIENHLFTVSAMGAPQRHDQRSYTLPIASYNSEYAKKQGINIAALDTASSNYNLINLGRQYNQHWGMIKRDRYNSNAPEERLSEKSNIYHKPQFSLRHFWTASDFLKISTIAYLSIGKGGGDGTRNSIKTTNLIQDPIDPNYGQINWQSIYDANSKPYNTGFGLVYPINPNYSGTLYVSSNYLTRQHNEHYWYGLLTKFNYQTTSATSFSGGIDLRSYRGIHYRTITDLLGGDYAVDESDNRKDYNQNPSAAMKYTGDTIQYFYEGLVKWGGLYFQAEHRFSRVIAFINLTSAINGYKKVDYFMDAESPWIWRGGFTFKTGGSFLMSERSRIFMNLGYLSKVRAFKHYYQGYTTNFQDNLNNEVVRAIELGYNYSSETFSLFFNTYYTLWSNKPPENQIRSTYILQPGEHGYVPDGGDDNEIDVYANIPGIDARHMGVELDLIYLPHKLVEFQGTFSFGDWIWTSKVEDLQYFSLESNEPVNKLIDFDARGIHVGDAAQNQIITSIKLKPFKRYYLTLRQSYRSKYFSSFNPEATYDKDGNVVDSWQIPDFNLFDVHTGYGFKLKNVFENAFFNVKFSVLNLLDTPYIWDAINNDGYGPYTNYKDFDAKSATVFFGLGRRYNFSFKVTF